MQEQGCPGHWIHSNVACNWLLELVKLCKKASVVLGDTMEEVSANFATSRQSQLVLMNLKKVLATGHCDNREYCGYSNYQSFA
jgi:hypothetical protein